MRILSASCFLLILMFSALRAQPVEFVVHSGTVTPTSEISEDFAVRINGEPAPVEFMSDFRIETHNNSGWTTGQHHVVQFSMRGPIEIEVDFLHEAPSYWIRPGAFEIDSDRIGNTVSFTLHFPHYYVLRTNDNGNRRELYLLVDPLPENAPQPGDRNVLTASSLGWANDGTQLSTSDVSAAQLQIQNDPNLDILYFEPGLYNYEAGRLSQRTGVGTYLAGSAYLIADGLGATWQEAFWLRGRGVLTTRDRSSSGRGGKHIQMAYSRNYLMQGIISRNSSDWNTVSMLSDDGLFLDWKVVNSWNWVNNDGVNTNLARRITVDRYFVSASADNSSDKANIRVSSTPDARDFRRDVRDITRRDGVFHSDAKSLKFGTESDVEYMENFLFEDMFAVNNGGPQSHLADMATLRNVTMRNYHVDEGEAMVFLVQGWSGRNPNTGNINGMELNGIFAYRSRAAILRGFSPNNLIQNVSMTNVLLGSDGFATSTDALNLTHTAGIDVNIEPIVWAAHDRYGLIGEAVPMNAYAYHDTATWSVVEAPGEVSFDDASDPKTSVTFSAQGEYILRLTADAHPDVYDQLVVTVLDPDFLGEPSARFLMLPTFPVTGQSVTFDASVSFDPDGSLTQYAWDFGDGRELIGSERAVTHTYTNSGRYETRLTITDNEGNTRTVRDFIHVRPAPEPFGGQPHPVPGRIEAEDYDLGTPNLTYRDRTPGDSGASNESLELYRPVQRFVEEYDRTPAPDIQASTDPADPDGFELTDIDPQGTRYEWVSYTLDVARAGLYDITLRANPNAANVDRRFSLYLNDEPIAVSEPWGRSANYLNKVLTDVAIDSAGEHVLWIVFEADIEGLNYIEFVQTGSPVPVACFEIEVGEGLSPREVTFDASCSTGAGVAVDHYTWDFGDGTILETNEPLVTHTYASTGSYAVELTVQNAAFNTDRSTQTFFLGRATETAGAAALADPHAVATFQPIPGEAGQPTRLAWAPDGYPVMPEPLRSNYLAGVAPTARAELEARMEAARSTALWVSPSGNAGATGTEADPMNLAEASAAAATSPGRSILFKPGTYDARGFGIIVNYSSGLSSSANFVLGAPDGPAILSAGHSLLLSEAINEGDGTWTFSFDGSLRDTPTDSRLMIVEDGGDGRTYFSRADSAADVANEPQSYFYDVSTSTLTVRFANEATDLVIGCSNAFARFSSVSAEIGLYGLVLNHFRGGAFHFSNSHVKGYDVHVNYAWNFAHRTDAWGFGGNTQALLERCSGNFAQNDGFNQKGTNTYVRLVDCEAIGNNDDGFSPHRETELWEVWGGLYQNNGKGNITPAGGRGFIIGATLDNVLGRMDGYDRSGSFRGLALNAETTQLTWIKDSIIRAEGSNSRGVFNADGTSYVFIENSRIEDASTGLYVESGGHIFANNVQFVGTDLDYDPERSRIQVVYSVRTYDVPDGERLNTQFTITANGLPVPVVDEVRTYAHFSFAGEVEIEVTGLDSHTLSPIDYGIEPTFNDGERMVFTLNRPRYLVLHKGRTNELVIFADPLEVDPPRPDDPNVLDYSTWNGTLQEAVDRVSFDPLYDIVYLPAGIYAQRGNIRLPSHTALYLAGGAKLDFRNGGIQVVEAEGVRIFGRGLIEYNENGGNHKNFGIWTSFARNLEIEGITSRNSLNWNVLLEDSEDIEANYFKVLNDRAGEGE